MRSISPLFAATHDEAELPYAENPAEAEAGSADVMPHSWGPSSGGQSSSSAPVSVHDSERILPA